MRFKLYQTQQRQTIQKTCLRNPKYATDLFIIFYEMHLHTGTVTYVGPTMGEKKKKKCKVKSLSQF